jgi:hypothetical protein
VDRIGWRNGHTTERICAGEGGRFGAAGSQQHAKDRDCGNYNYQTLKHTFSPPMNGEY